jgi:hypothetical protein
MARQVVGDAAVRAQGGVERIDRGAWNAEGAFHTFAAEYLYGSVDRFDPGHRRFSFDLESIFLLMDARMYQVLGGENAQQMVSVDIRSIE